MSSMMNFIKQLLIINIVCFNSFSLLAMDYFDVLYAARQNNKAYFERCINGGSADVVTCADANNIQPIHVAAMWGHGDLCKLLLFNMANPNIKARSNGFAALHFAVFSNRTRLVAILLDHGAEINMQDAMFRTALHIAVNSSNYSIIETLLGNEKIKLDVIDKFGFTPLMYAAQRGDIIAVTMLVKAGAGVFLKNEINGKRVIDYAFASGNADVKNYLALAILKTRRVKWHMVLGKNA